MSHTVCSPVISMRFSLGPSVTLMLSDEQCEAHEREGQMSAEWACGLGGGFAGWMAVVRR